MEEVEYVNEKAALLAVVLRLELMYEDETPDGEYKIDPLLRLLRITPVFVLFVTSDTTIVIAFVVVMLSKLGEVIKDPDVVPLATTYPLALSKTPFVTALYPFSVKSVTTDVDVFNESG